MERLLNPDIIKQLQEVFSKLVNPVEIWSFSSQANCELCDETRQLLQEVAEAAPDKIAVKVFDLDQDAAIAAQYGIDKAPMFLIGGNEDGKLLDYGIRFSGIPAGHEFATLVTSIVDVSRREPQLEEQSMEFLAGLKEPVHMMVFVTPT